MSGQNGPDQPGYARYISGVNILLGIWMILTPFVLGYTDETGSLVNAFIVGILVAALAAVRVRSLRTIIWPSWLNAGLGLWLIGSSWEFSDGMNGTILTNNTYVGMAIIILGLWSGVASSLANQAAEEFQH